METIRLGFCCRKQMCIKFTKGAMQGPLGDIGRHGDYLGDTGTHRDSKTINCRNLTKGAM